MSANFIPILRELSFPYTRHCFILVRILITSRKNMLFWQLYFSPELHGMILELSLVKASYGSSSPITSRRVKPSCITRFSAIASKDSTMLQIFQNFYLTFAKVSKQLFLRMIKYNLLIGNNYTINSGCYVHFTIRSMTSIKCMLPSWIVALFI